MIGLTIKELHLDVNTAYGQDVDKLVWFFDHQQSLALQKDDQSVNMFDWIKSGQADKFLSGKDS